MTNSTSILINRLKYFWFVVIMKLTWVLPDWQPFMRLRGFLAKPCFQASDGNLQFACDVTINFPGKVCFGSDVYIAKGCWLHATGGITIHDEVMLAPYVVVVTGNHTQKMAVIGMAKLKERP